MQNPVFKHYTRKTYATSKSRKRWTTSALGRIGVGDTAIARIFEESRAAHSAIGPQIERLRQ